MIDPALKTFLEGPRRPAEALRYHELQGFLFAVAAVPDTIPPSAFLPLVWGGKEPAFADATEARTLMGGVVELFNEISTGLAEPGARLPDDCAFRDDPLANFESDAPVSQWSRGFARGHTWLRAAWEGCMPKALEGDVTAMTLTLGFFSSRAVAQEFVATATDGSKTLATLTEEMQTQFPGALADYARIGRTLFKALVERETGQAARKVGRNDPCPCGSGKKFKQCCHGEAHAN